MGGKSESEDAFGEMDFAKVRRFVTEQGCKKELNPPHASHFGGVWGGRPGPFVAFWMACLWNSMTKSDRNYVRLLTAIPADVDNPQPLSPAMS